MIGVIKPLPMLNKVLIAKKVLFLRCNANPPSQKRLSEIYYIHFGQRFQFKRQIKSSKAGVSLRTSVMIRFLFHLADVFSTTPASRSVTFRTPMHADEPIASRRRSLKINSGRWQQ